MKFLIKKKITGFVTAVVEADSAEEVEDKLDYSNLKLDDYTILYTVEVKPFDVPQET